MNEPETDPETREYCWMITGTWKPVGAEPRTATKTGIISVIVEDGRQEALDGAILAFCNLVGARDVQVSFLYLEPNSLG
jgi:hypothetical protein